MLANKRKTRLFAFSSIVCQQAGPPGQTLRARRIWPVSALEMLENQSGFLRLSAFSQAKSDTQNRMVFMSP